MKPGLRRTWVPGSENKGFYTRRRFPHRKQTPGSISMCRKTPTSTTVVCTCCMCLDASLLGGGGCHYTTLCTWQICLPPDFAHQARISFIRRAVRAFQLAKMLLQFVTDSRGFSADPSLLLSHLQSLFSRNYSFLLFFFFFTAYPHSFDYFHRH